MSTHQHEPARLRVCIVDEHAVVREWLASRLEGLGFEICATSETIRDGVQSILTHRPDLAVVDDRLPDGRGIDLCREISGAAPDVALILHAGVIRPLEARQASEPAVARIALKSIRGDELMAAVAEFATQRRGARSEAPSRRRSGSAQGPVPAPKRGTDGYDRDGRSRATH